MGAYEEAIRRARRAARRMLAAEVEVGRIAAEIGIDRIAEMARDVGVRRSILVAAMLAAQGAVKRHRALEREVADRVREADMA